MSVNDEFEFRVDCDAGDHGQLQTNTDTFAVNVAQPIMRDGRAELWDVVLVHGAREQDGSFTIKVTLSSPAWDEPMTIAVVRSSLEVEEAFAIEFEA